MRVVVLTVLVAAYVGLALVPSWQKVRSVKHGRDFATYFYAVQVAGDGGDPYETPLLRDVAREDGTRGKVHPYFYPPPFLLGMTWALPLDLPTAYRVFFWVNQVCLGSCLWVLRRWFRADWLLLAAISATFTPFPDNTTMGQANIPVLLLALVGLWRGWGAVIGAAAMAKMSPALYLAAYAAKGAWKIVLAAAIAGLALSAIALPLVDLESQLRFYNEVLPGFSSGNYHGLTVPISLPANHSIPDLWNQLWPGADNHSLSDRARAASAGVSLALLCGLCAIARTGRDALGEACLAGAFTVLLLVAPIYTYEHHLVFLLLPAVAAGQAWIEGRLDNRLWPVLVLAYASVAWPLSWLRFASRALPDLAWVFQESKFFGAMALGALCAWAAVRSPAKG